jgi:hypothetical protein
MPWEMDPTSNPIEVSWSCSCRIWVMSMPISITASISPSPFLSGAVVHSTLSFSPVLEVSTSSCLRDLAILEGLLHRADQALLVTVLVAAIAVLADRLAEGLDEMAVGMANHPVLALHGNQARQLGEELPEALLAFVQLSLQGFDLGDVRVHLHHGDDFTVRIADRRRPHHHRHRATVPAGQQLLAAVAQAVLERGLDRAVRAHLVSSLVDLVAVLADPVPEVSLETSGCRR